MNYLRDQAGIETLEWLTIGALVVAAAFIAIRVEISPGMNDAAHLLRLLITGMVPSP